MDVRQSCPNWKSLGTCPCIYAALLAPIRILVKPHWHPDSLICNANMLMFATLLLTQKPFGPLKSDHALEMCEYGAFAAGFEPDDGRCDEGQVVRRS